MRRGLLDEFEPQTRKQIKLDDESTVTWDKSTAMQHRTRTDAVPFLSQRQRYGHMTNNLQEAPLPIVYQEVLQKVKQLDYNLWKRKQVTVSDLDAFRVRQVLSLDEKFYVWEVVGTSISISLPVLENMHSFQQNSFMLPQALSHRQKHIRQLLLERVQREIDLDNLDEVEPRDVGLPPLISNRYELMEQCERLRELFERRGVTFMYKRSVNIDDLNTLLRLVPDFVREKNEIIQLNKQINLETLSQRLLTFSI